MLTAKLEIKAIDDAASHRDREFLAQYGGFAGALKRAVALQRWVVERMTVKQEIKAIDDAMTHGDENFLALWGGFGEAMKRSAYLQKLPDAKLTEGVSIDDYSTWRAVRFADRDEGV